MNAVQKAIERQSIELAVPETDIRALTVLPGSDTVMAATSGAEVLFFDHDLRAHVRTQESVDQYGDSIHLVELEGLAPDRLLAANYNSAREYAIDGDRLTETRKWDLVSRKSTAASVAIGGDGSGGVKAAVAYDYLHLLRDDGSTESVREPDNPFWGLTVAAGGSHLANGRMDGTVELRNSETLEVEKTLGGLQSLALCLASSPDRKHLAASDDNGRLRVWNLETGTSAEIPNWSKAVDLFWFSDSSGFVSIGLSRWIAFHDLEALQEPASIQLDEYKPLYAQHAVLRDDANLFVFVEKSGIVQIGFG